MDQPIAMPKLVRQSGNMQSQKPPISNGGNSFLAGALVVIASALLRAVATAETSVYGWCVDASIADTIPANQPPNAFFGLSHYPFDLDNEAELVLNVGSLSGTALVVGEANSAKQAQDAVVGTSYGIATATTGAYAGYQVLDTTNTTNKIFTVVGYPDGTEGTDYNGLVRVKIVPATLQA